MTIRFIKQRANLAVPAGAARDSIDWARYPDGIPLDFNGNATFHILVDSGNFGFNSGIQYTWCA
jgi:hypothetical protein